MWKKIRASTVYTVEIYSLTARASWHGLREAISSAAEAYVAKVAEMTFEAIPPILKRFEEGWD